MFSKVTRFLKPSSYNPVLDVPKVRIQPVLAREGEPSVKVADVARCAGDNAIFNELVCVKDPEHWNQLIANLGDDVDLIMPISSPCYPTEIWNECPEALVKRGIPVLFWPLIEFDEPDFWKWSAADFLRALGCQVHLVKNCAEGNMLLRALRVKKFLANGKMVVFGKQNFPWNALAGGKLIKDNIGTQLIIRPLESFREAGAKFSDGELLAYWEEHKARYIDQVPGHGELVKALRTWFGIKSVLEEEKAFGFGVNCYGELLTSGGRDVPCLAQALAREEGYIASCDGDYCAMLNMAMISFLLNKPCMMSNIYPLSYAGALNGHFGDPLDAPQYSGKKHNLARMGHCGYVGVVPAEMSPSGKARLCDWGGTYEMKRDGLGCGVDCDLAGNQEFTGIELHLNGKDLLIAHGKVLETSRHPFPHCETTGLLEFDDLEYCIKNISREHLVLGFGDFRRDMEILAEVMKLNIL